MKNAVADTSTTEIKLGANIILKDYLDIYTTPNLTIDLNGYTIDGKTNSKTVYIYFGRNTTDEYTDCSLTIKDSSPDKTGTIITSDYININSRFVKEKSVTLTIEGGNFYTKTNGIFYLEPNGYMKNTEVNFFIKEGYFKTNFWVEYAFKLLRIGTNTQTIEGKDITLNVKFDKLTCETAGSYCPGLIYLKDGTLTLDDVVSKDSKIYTNASIRTEITDRTILATSDDRLGQSYSTLKITKDYCFDVSDVTLTETYGYAEATPVPISIYNRGEREPNIVLLKAYSEYNSSPRIESEDFIIDIKDKLMPSGATNAKNTIKAKADLSVGDYEATIAVVDSAGNTYKSKVTLTVKPKELLHFAIGGVSEKITYGTSYDPKPTGTGTNQLTPADYKIAYFKRGETTPLKSKPTDVGEYTVAIALTNKNYEVSEPITTFDYAIIAKSLNTDDVTVTLEPASFEYTGSAIKPAPVVKDGTKTLIRGRDYKLSYSGNINTGENTATVKVTGKGNYIGSVEKTFSITSRTSTGEMQQIINFTDSSITKTYGDSKFTIEVNQITGDGTVTYSSSEPTVATVDVTTGNVTIEGVGETIIKAVAAASGDYATAEATYTLKVNKKQLVKPELLETSFEYSGKEIDLEEPLLEAYYADFMEVNGDFTGSAVGNYQVKFSLTDKTNSEWADETTDDVVIDWYITGVKLEKPELTQTSFVYTGKPIAISVPSTVRLKYIKASGDLEKTDVGGNYQVTFALKDTENCKWTDGGTKNVTLVWKIEKATPTIEISNLSQQVGSVVAPTYTVTPAITDGTVKVEYNLSTADDSSYTTDLPTEAGTYNVKVSVSGDKNLNDTSEVATLEIINPTTILEDWVTVDTSTTHIYSGSPIKPTVTVYDGTNTLGENTDYILYYENNINAGKGKVKVTGIGNYTGEIEKEFTITPKSITLTINAIEDQTYTGEQITPGIIISCAETLTQGTDYKVEYGTNTDVGTGKVTIKAVSGSNYTFTDVTQTFNIVSNTTTTKTKLTKVTLKESSYSYSGSAISVEFNNYNDSLMTKTGDLTGTNAKSDYSITIALKDTANYEWADGTTADLTLTWGINKKSITPKIEDILAVTYNGSNHTPELVVKDGTTTLEKGKDYTVEYTNNLNAGEADAEITAVSTSNYTFTTTGKSFIINKYEIKESDVTLEYTSVKADGTAKKPTVTVKMGTTVIDSLKYNVSYTNNTDIGEADVTVAIKEGDTNFTGSVTVHFNIVDKETVTISGITDNQEFTYDGTAKTPQGTLTVTDNKVNTSALEISYAGKDGTSYSSTTAPTEVGIYTVTYKVPDSDGTYTGTATFTFKIKKVQLAKPTFEKTTYTYTGENISIEFPESFKNAYMYTTNSGYGEVAMMLKDVKTYSFNITLRAPGHYEWSDGSTEDLPLTLYVEKATPTIEISNLSQKVGSVVAPTYTVTPAVTDGTVKVEYKLSTAEDTEYTATLPTKAGTYNVKVSVTGDKNLNDTSEIATLTITKKTTGGGGGGSSTTTYAITVKENENAEITPNGTVKVEKGSDKTFKITAKEGYEIEDVLVDGKSVGAVSKYTFENVKAKHTLEVKVKKVEEEKPTTPEVKETFKDVKKGDWYFEAVEYVAKKGLMNGTGNDMFSPNATTTRGMIVTILYRLEGEPAVEECSFTDVPSDAYYAKAIAWAEKNGIVLGLGEGKFGPDEEITREQLATIMYRYSMYKKYDTSVAENTNILSYNDIQDLAEYAFQAMQYACGEGLISGMGNGNLNPKGNATRAQLATILMRYCEKYMK